MFESVCGISESGISQNIVNPDDQLCVPVLHVLHAQCVFTQGDTERLCGAEMNTNTSDRGQKDSTSIWSDVVYSTLWCQLMAVDGFLPLNPSV